MSLGDELFPGRINKKVLEDNGELVRHMPDELPGLFESRTPEVAESTNLPIIPDTLERDTEELQLEVPVETPVPTNTRLPSFKPISFDDVIPESTTVMTNMSDIFRTAIKGESIEDLPNNGGFGPPLNPTSDLPLSRQLLNDLKAQNPFHIQDPKQREHEQEVIQKSVRKNNPNESLDHTGTITDEELDRAKKLFSNLTSEVRVTLSRDPEDRMPYINVLKISGDNWIHLGDIKFDTGAWRLIPEGPVLGSPLRADSITELLDLVESSTNKKIGNNLPMESLASRALRKLTPINEASSVRKIDIGDLISRAGGTENILQQGNPINTRKILTQLNNDLATDLYHAGALHVEKLTDQDIDNWIQDKTYEYKETTSMRTLRKLHEVNNNVDAYGNKYPYGIISYEGMTIEIENREGSIRTGVGWQTLMHHHYGFIQGVKGADKDEVDVFINPKACDASLNLISPKVFIVNQLDQKTDKFDEHKVMLGFDTEAEAREAYLSNYTKGWKVGTIKELNPKEFKDWLSRPGATMKKAESLLHRFKSVESSEPSTNKPKQSPQDKIQIDRAKLALDQAKAQTTESLADKLSRRFK